MSEELQKGLDKNYSKVQKKELKVGEVAEKLLANYEKTVKDLAVVVKNENKDYKGIDKNIKDEHKSVLKTIKDEHKSKSSDVDSRVKDANKLYTDEIGKADAKNLKEVTKQEGLIEKANNASVKENEKVLKAYEKDVANKNDDIAKVASDFASDSAKLQEKHDDRKAKYDEKVAALTEKRDTKIAKLNEQSTSKIDKLNSDIENQRAKTDKQIADLVPIYDEKMAEVDALVNEELAEYENKTGNIQSTLDSKITRRNKFLEKAENENDTKAAKQQRKEIKELTVNADRELKIIRLAHEDRNKDLASKKREINKNNLEQIAAAEREFTSFKEDCLMQIELNKATLADDLTKTKLDTELKLLDELSKFDEFLSKHTVTVAEVTEKFEKANAVEEDLLEKLLVEFDKVNEINASKLEEELAIRAKDLQLAAIAKDNDYVLAQLKLDVTTAKLFAEQEILDRQLEQDVLMNEEQELLKYHRNDYDKQASVKTEFLSSQEAISELYQGRAKELLEYEELEVINRADLKVGFLETHRLRVEQDNKNLIERIENAFNQEKEFFENEISTLSDNDKAALSEFKLGKEEEIQELVDEKAELDPQADKRRIADLATKINGLKADLNAEIKSREDQILVKIKIYQDNLELCVNRKDKALEEAKELFDFENTNITYAVELVNQNKDSELQEARARYAKTLTSTNNFINAATNRNTKTTDENTKYLTDREDKENSIIENAKLKFENQRNALTNEKDAKLSSLESDKAALEARIKQETATEELNLEAIVNRVASQVAASEAKASQRLSALAQQLATKNREFEASLKDKLSKAATELKIKENRYKESVAQIDKKADVEKKTYEVQKTRVQKEYEIELKKAITNINARLDADIKAL